MKNLNLCKGKGWKSIISLSITVAMVFSLLPGLSLPTASAAAYNDYSGCSYPGGTPIPQLVDAVGIGKVSLDYVNAHKINGNYYAGDKAPLFILQDYEDSNGNVGQKIIPYTDNYIIEANSWLNLVCGLRDYEAAFLGGYYMDAANADFTVGDHPETAWHFVVGDVGRARWQSDHFSRDSYPPISNWWKGPQYLGTGANPRDNNTWTDEELIGDLFIETSLGIKRVKEYFGWQKDIEDQTTFSFPGGTGNTGSFANSGNNVDFFIFMHRLFGTHRNEWYLTFCQWKNSITAYDTISDIKDLGWNNRVQKTFLNQMGVYDTSNNGGPAYDSWKTIWNSITDNTSAWKNSQGMAMLTYLSAMGSSNYYNAYYAGIKELVQTPEFRWIVYPRLKMDASHIVRWAGSCREEIPVHSNDYFDVKHIYIDESWLSATGGAANHVIHGNLYKNKSGTNEGLYWEMVPLNLTVIPGDPGTGGTPPPGVEVLNLNGTSGPFTCEWSNKLELDYKANVAAGITKVEYTLAVPAPLGTATPFPTATYAPGRVVGKSKAHEGGVLSGYSYIKPATGAVDSFKGSDSELYFEETGKYKVWAKAYTDLPPEIWPDGAPNPIVTDPYNNWPHTFTPCPEPRLIGITNFEVTVDKAEIKLSDGGAPVLKKSFEYDGTAHDCNVIDALLPNFGENNPAANGEWFPKARAHNLHKFNIKRASLGTITNVSQTIEGFTSDVLFTGGYGAAPSPAPTGQPGSPKEHKYIEIMPKNSKYKFEVTPLTVKGKWWSSIDNKSTWYETKNESRIFKNQDYNFDYKWELFPGWTLPPGVTLGALTYKIKVTDPEITASNQAKIKAAKDALDNAKTVWDKYLATPPTATEQEKNIAVAELITALEELRDIIPVHKSDLISAINALWSVINNALEPGSASEPNSMYAKVLAAITGVEDYFLNDGYIPVTAGQLPRYTQKNVKMYNGEIISTTVDIQVTAANGNLVMSPYWSQNAITITPFELEMWPTWYDAIGSLAVPIGHQTVTIDSTNSNLGNAALIHNGNEFSFNVSFDCEEDIYPGTDDVTCYKLSNFEISPANPNFTITEPKYVNADDTCGNGMPDWFEATNINGELPSNVWLEVDGTLQFFATWKDIPHRIYCFGCEEGGESGRKGDVDQDGITNFEEYLLGFPSVALAEAYAEAFNYGKTELTYMGEGSYGPIWVNVFYPCKDMGGLDKLEKVYGGAGPFPAPVGWVSGDQWTDWNGTYPRTSDTDKDGFDDKYEYYFSLLDTLNRYNPTNRQADGTAAALPNPTADYDNDGLNNYQEYLLWKKGVKVSPLKADTDTDNFDDGWEILVSFGKDNAYPDFVISDIPVNKAADHAWWNSIPLAFFTNLTFDPTVGNPNLVDPTNCYMTNIDKYDWWKQKGLPLSLDHILNPLKYDTAGDGIADGWKYFWKKKVYPASTCYDNLMTKASGGILETTDTDGDGYTDRQEFILWHTKQLPGHPNNLYQLKAGTTDDGIYYVLDPFKADTDVDTASDWKEVKLGSNPLDPAMLPTEPPTPPPATHPANPEMPNVSVAPNPIPLIDNFTYGTTTIYNLEADYAVEVSFDNFQTQGQVINPGESVSGIWADYPPNVWKARFAAFWGDGTIGELNIQYAPGTAQKPLNITQPSLPPPPTGEPTTHPFENFIPNVIAQDETWQGENDGYIKNLEDVYAVDVSQDITFNVGVVTIAAGAQQTLPWGTYFVRWSANWNVNPPLLASAVKTQVTINQGPIKPGSIVHPMNEFPVNISHTNETVYNAWNGTITNLDTNWPVKIATNIGFTTDVQYLSAASVATGLKPGNYFIRWAETGIYAQGSIITMITILPAGGVPSQTPPPPSPTRTPTPPPASPTPTRTPTPVPASPTPTQPGATANPTATPTPTPTQPGATANPTATPTLPAGATLTPTATPTITPTSKSTITPTPTKKPGTDPDDYTDVPTPGPGDPWWGEAVREMIKRELINGKGTDANGKPYFAPDDELTRAEFCQIIAKMSNESYAAVVTTVMFSDIKSALDDAPTGWFNKAISWAAGKTPPIVKGYPELGGGFYFDPNKNISRQEICAMINRFAKYKDVKLPTDGPSVFTDVTAANWGLDDVTAIAKAGIVNGMGPAAGGGIYFGPDLNTRRNEAATMLYRLLEIVEKQTTPPTQSPTVPVPTTSPAPTPVPT